MGQLLDLLQGISLPPDTESKVRILDLQLEQMEVTIKELTSRVKGTSETHRLNRFEGEPRFTPRVKTRPDDPTDDEAAVLKVLLPPGRQVDANTIARLMRQDPTTTQTHLNELQKKDYIHKS